MLNKKKFAAKSSFSAACSNKMSTGTAHSSVSNCNKSFNEQSGRSFIEMIGVIVVFGLLSIIGFFGHHRMMMRYKIDKTLDIVTTLSSRTRIVFAKQDNYNGLSTASAIEVGIAEDEMKDTSSTINGPFGLIEIDGQVARYLTYGDNTRETAFRIKLHTVPKEACGIIASSFWNSTLSKGFLGVGINKDTTDCKINVVSNSEKVACTYEATDQGNFGETIQNATKYCKDLNDIYLKFN